MNWKKVQKCKHTNISENYSPLVFCGGAEGCRGEERHCLDCGVYIQSCGCGNCNSYSGWPHKRHVNLKRKKRMALHNLYMAAGSSPNTPITPPEVPAAQ